jgi:hypothetical protein
MRKQLLFLALSGVIAVFTAGAANESHKGLPATTKYSMLRNAHNPLQETPRTLTAAPQRITDDGRVDANDVLITDPVGEKRVYSRNADSWYYYYDNVYHAYDYGYAQEVVFGDNNEVYFKNPFGGWVTDSYLKGTIEGDEIVVNLPQYILNYKTYKYTAKLATVALDADGYPDATLSDDQVLRFSYKDGIIKQLNEGVSLAMYGPSNYWVNYADGAYEMTLLDEETVADPGVESKEYSMLYDEDGHHVSIATVGNDFYIKGVSASLPDVWSKGEISGSTVTLKPQYLGVIDNHHAYFVPGQLTVDQVQDTYYYTYNLKSRLNLTYNADEDKYTIPQDYSFVINTNKDFADAIEYYDNAVIVYQGDVTVAKPATPLITDVWTTDDPWEGTNYIDFDLYKTDINGNLLDADRLYYNLYFDDEVATLFCDDYIYAKTDMTDFPYSYDDGHDVFADGLEHLIYLYAEGFDKIGVQAIYRSSNGEDYRSDIAFYDVATKEYYTEEFTGVGDVTISKSVKSTEYFDLTGRRVAQPASGIYVKRVSYTDGTVSTSKQVVK